MSRLSIGFVLLFFLPFTPVFGQAYFFEFDTYDEPNGGDAIPIMHGTTAVPQGYLVQVILPGTDTLLEPPQTDPGTAGMPGTGNFLSSTFSVGSGCGTNGCFDVFLTGIAIATDPRQIATGSTFWARVWTVPRGTSYGVAFSGMQYCNCGPFICPPATANPWGFGPEVICTAIPTSANPTWFTLPFIGGPVFSITVSGMNLRATYSFGNVAVGSTGRAPVVISNSGGAGLTLTGVFLPAGRGFSWTQALPATITAGGSINDTLIFSPTFVGVTNDTLRITHNATGSPYNCVLSGTGVAVPVPQFGITIGGNGYPVAYDFGSVPVRSVVRAPVIITNGGTATLSLIGAFIPAVPGFSWTHPLTMNVPAGDNHLDTLIFAPAEIGATSDTFRITHNATGSPYSCTLSGIGTGYTVRLPSSDTTFPNVLEPQHRDSISLILNVQGNRPVASGRWFVMPDTMPFSSPAVANLPVGDNTVKIYFQPQHQAYYTARMGFISNALNGDTLYIDVNAVSHYTPAPPGHLRITADSINTYLAWNRVDTATVGVPINITFYLIYCRRNSSAPWGFLDYTNGSAPTSYTHLNSRLTNLTMYYRVIALVVVSNDSHDALRSIPRRSPETEVMRLLQQMR